MASIMKFGSQMKQLLQNISQQKIKNNQQEK
jgi:hypothetical protein